MIKRKGESGSPWRTPLSRLKEGVEKPLFVTELDKLLWNVLIRVLKDTPKPKDSSDFDRKSQFRESKAFSKSIAVIIPL